MDALAVTGYVLAGFGLLVVLTLAYLGGKMVYLALQFSVNLAFSEYKFGKLKRASDEAKADFLAKNLNTDTDTDNADTTPQAKKEEKPSKPKR